MGSLRFFIILSLCILPRLVFGLEPSEVLVVANKDMAGSVDLAKYYMGKRGIPPSHLLSLSLSLEETMARQEYDQGLVPAVTALLDKLQLNPPKQRIAAIVLMYGVPLKVAAPVPGRETIERIQDYRLDQKKLEENSNEDVPDIKIEKKRLGEKISELLNLNQRAAVDSELSLVKVTEYDLNDWIKNPYYLGYQGQALAITKNDVLLVSRLDGPDPETVYRVIDDTLWAEKHGLQGRAYFDARWSEAESAGKNDGYGFYDLSLHKIAKIVGHRLPVTLDETGQLFAPQACPDAALYCGWYSLGQYVDSFAWQRGAIGYHIASSECTTLRKSESKVWCKQMLEKGVAATIGPVHEPYVQGFPLPQIFFAQLIEGYMSLGEAYLVSLPYISWQMVLVGDPLYQPFSPLELSSTPEG
ncbi:TIGR03790 family protein [Desulforhopalus sp. 52FAK]